MATETKAVGIAAAPHVKPTVDHEETKENMSAVVEATERQKSMTIAEAVRAYPKAIMYSAVLSTAIIMEGFDLGLIGSFFAFPQFTERYGNRQADGSYEISAAWQSGLTNGALAGQILGLMVAGWFTERFGYRRTMSAGLLVTLLFIFIPFFSPHIEVLVVGQILCGAPWGMFQAVTTVYAADLCPVALRAYLTTYVNLCFVMGQLLSTGVLRATIGLSDQWAYRIPFGLQWMWPLPIMVGCYLAPESPWWLIRHDRIEDAKAVLLRLGPAQENTTSQTDATIAMMIYTNELERKNQEGASYRECFLGINLRRTEIACMAYASQMICGSSLMGYSVYFYRQAGLPTTQALNLSIGQFAIGFVGTICSWWLMHWFGRRTLYIFGTAVSFVVLIGIGIGGIPKQTETTAWAVGSLLLTLTCFYNISIGPICFCIVSEIPSTRLRAKTVVLARAVYNICGIVCNILTPSMINPTAWAWGPKAGFFWAGICFLCLVWMYFRLPEAKGRTYGELQVLFQQRVSARRFASTEVAQFESTTASC